MYKCGWQGCEKAYGTLNHLNAHVTMQSHGQKRTPEGQFQKIQMFVAKALFGLACAYAPLVILQPLALLHQKEPYCWRRHYVAYSLTLAILKISWARLAPSMKLAPTNVFVQSSRRFEKSGNNVKRKKSSSERLKKIGSVPPTEVVNLRPTPTRLAGRTIHLGQVVLSCLRLDMRRPEIRVLLLAIQAESTRCIRPRVMVRSIQDTLTPPMAKASKCTCTYPNTYIYLIPILSTNPIP